MVTASLPEHRSTEASSANTEQKQQHSVSDEKRKSSGDGCALGALEIRLTESRFVTLLVVAARTFFLSL
jgi:hypothetical protein